MASWSCANYPLIMSVNSLLGGMIVFGPVCEAAKRIVADQLL